MGTRKSVLVLALLSPLIGEFLLGNVTIRDIGALLFLAPLYGGGAVLIREVTRRTGKGWPTMLVLGLAYGLLEAGVFDGSLFSASYEGMDYSGARIPALGVSAFYGLQFVVNHAVWSIGIPILLTESLASDTGVTRGAEARRGPGVGWATPQPVSPRDTGADRPTQPWLGRVGLAVTAVVYLVGGLLIQRSSVSGGEYHVSWARAAGVVLVALVLVATAVRLPGPKPRESAGPRRPERRTPGWVPRPWVVAVASFAAAGSYFVLPATWPGVALMLMILVPAGWLVVHAVRRAGWHTGHRVALAAGALLTYAWGGFLLTGLKHDADPAAFAGNVAFTVGAIVLIAAAARRGVRARSSATAQ